MWICILAGGNSCGDGLGTAMSDLHAVVEVKWLLAAFPEAEIRGDTVWLNGSAFPLNYIDESGYDWAVRVV